MEGIGAILYLALIVLGIILAIAWIIMPFALIGTKPLLRQLVAEVKKMNELSRQQNINNS